MKRIISHKFQVIIGLEVHAQLNTKTKLFCRSKNDSRESMPNTNICSVCMGHPGVLPTLNKEAVDKIIRAGLSLECKINKFAKFDRKNYFYPDLPKGYQISQYDKPFCLAGKFMLKSGKIINITRIHLEEDAGKLVHEKAGESLVDYNRAGAPLIELVTAPDFSSIEEVLEFAKGLQLLWRYLGISYANMELGEFRVEPNISIKKLQNSIRKLSDKIQENFKVRIQKLKQDNGLPDYKVELKNLNSFKVVKDALQYEIERQIKALENNEKLHQETRSWDEKRKKTISQREKEGESDYRYFTEPDLPGISLTDEYIEKIKKEIPELPKERENRFILEYSLPLNDVFSLIINKELGEYFEKVVSELRSWERSIERPEVIETHMPRLIKLVANYLITEIGDKIYDLGFKISAENFAELVVLTHQGKITSTGAQNVLNEMIKTGNDPHNIIQEHDLNQISDKGELENIIKEVISNNKKPVNDYKAGKQSAIQFLVGQVMAKSRGKANPKIAEEMLKKEL